MTKQFQVIPRYGQQIKPKIKKLTKKMLKRLFGIEEVTRKDKVKLLLLEH